MANLNLTQTITPQEAKTGLVTQGGQETKQAPDVEKLAAFKKAHAAQKQAAAMLATPKQQPANAVPATQISVTEQSSAVMLAMAGKSQQGKSKALQAYEQLYTSDELFLQKDIESLLAALAKNEKSMADFSKASLEVIAMRKYLLATLAKEQKTPALSPGEEAQADALLAKLEAEYGDTIRSTLAALETLNESPRAGKIGVQEFISAYHSMGAQEGQDDEVLETMLALFTAIRKKKRADGSDEELGDYIAGMLDGFEKTLRREVGTNANNMAVPRQYAIFKRINSLRLLHMMFSMHRRYLKQLRKAKEPLNNIPQLGLLMEACMQALGDEIHTGCNMLVSLMSSIETPTKPAGNACMSLYMATVMTPKALQRICRNNTHQRMVRDILHDAQLKDGVLALYKGKHA